jgi:hypothetical protein
MNTDKLKNIADNTDNADLKKSIQQKIDNKDNFVLK